MMSMMAERQVSLFVRAGGMPMLSLPKRPAGASGRLNSWTGVLCDTLLSVAAASLRLSLSGLSTRERTCRLVRRSHRLNSSRPRRRRLRAHRPPTAAARPGAAAPAHPDGNQLRPRRRDRHRPQGQPSIRPQAGRVPNQGRRQAAGHRVVHGRQDRRLGDSADRRSSGARDPLDLRGAARGAAAGCPPVHHSAGRLPRAPRQRHGRAQAAHRVHREPARPSGHGRDHVSADAGHGPHVHPQPREPGERDRTLPGTALRLQADEPVRRAVRVLPCRNSRAGSQPGRHDGAQGRGDAPRRPARGAQVGHLRERGLHDHPAAAVERSERPDAGPG